MTTTQTATTVVEYLAPELGLIYFMPEVWADLGIGTVRHQVKPYLWTKGFAMEGTVDRGSCTKLHEGGTVEVWTWRTVQLDPDEVKAVHILGYRP